MTTNLMKTNLVNAFEVLEALGDDMPDDNTPLCEALPRAWPTVGDLRKLVCEALVERAE